MEKKKNRPGKLAKTKQTILARMIIILLQMGNKIIIPAVIMPGTTILQIKIILLKIPMLKITMQIP